MKTSQGSKTSSPEKGISEANEAQELLNFTRKFSNEQGRFPTLQELPRENNIVTYYFGSFENLLQLAWLGQSPPPLRKDKKKRYCRHCNKFLPQSRWFFCDDECERKFAERDDEILAKISKEINKPMKKPKRRMWYKCKGCGENCKIYLPIPLKEPKAKIICKASAGYEAANEMLIKETEGKQKLVIPKIE